MNQKNLQGQEKQEKRKEITQEQICKNCEYSQPTQFSLYSEKITWYCNKQYSKRTHNKKLKIKPKQEACHMYKKCTDNGKDIIIKSLYPYNMNQENLQKLEKQIKEIKDMYESLAGNIQY